MSDAVDDGDRKSPAEEISPLTAIAAGVVSVLTLAVAFGLLALGQPYFWVTFPVGFGGGMPLAVGLARWYESNAEADEDVPKGRNETDAALADLRERYARGELGDDEFERRVERLLETESVADATSFTERERTLSQDESHASKKEPLSETAREDGRE